MHDTHEMHVTLQILCLSMKIVPYAYVTVHDSLFCDLSTGKIKFSKTTKKGGSIGDAVKASSIIQTITLWMKFSLFFVLLESVVHMQ